MLEHYKSSAVRLEFVSSEEGTVKVCDSILFSLLIRTKSSGFGSLITLRLTTRREQ